MDIICSLILVRILDRFFESSLAFESSWRLAVIQYLLAGLFNEKPPAIASQRA